VAKKERTTEDFLDLGSLFKAADEALCSATVLAGNMYPLKAKQMERVDKVRTALRELRWELDGRWERELTVPDTEERTHPLYPFFNSLDA
jgi:hypothetical protein